MNSFLVPRDTLVNAVSTVAGISGTVSDVAENLFNSVTQSLGNLADSGADNAGRDALGGTGGVGGTNTNETESPPCSERSGTIGGGINGGENGMCKDCLSACIGFGITPGNGYPSEGCPECERLKNLFHAPMSYTGLQTSV